MNEIIQIDDTINLNELYTNYLFEIEQVVSSDNFLSGTAIGDSLAFNGSYMSIKCRICSIGEFSKEYDTDPDDYSSKLIILQEEFMEISQSLNAIESCITQEESDLLESKVQLISDRISTNSNFKKMVSKVFASVPSGSNPEFVSSFVHSTIATHLVGVMHGRTLTLSRRCIKAEAVLEAYRIGLFPFGWDKREEELLCVNPIDI